MTPLLEREYNSSTNEYVVNIIWIQLHRNWTYGNKEGLVRGIEISSLDLRTKSC
jgi:hypothetical protein